MYFFRSLSEGSQFNFIVTSLSFKDNYTHSLKSNGHKNILCSFARTLEVTNKACHSFFKPCLNLDIILLEHTICLPSWIFKDAHVRSKVGSRYAFNY